MFLSSSFVLVVEMSPRGVPGVYVSPSATIPDGSEDSPTFWSVAGPRSLATYCHAKYSELRCRYYAGEDALCARVLPGESSPIGISHRICFPHERHNDGWVCLFFIYSCGD